MTAKTRQLVNALIGFEREYDYPADPSDIMEWGSHNPELRYRWAALAALDDGDAATAGVLAQLAQAVALEHLGATLLAQSDDD